MSDTYEGPLDSFWDVSVASDGSLRLVTVCFDENTFDLTYNDTEMLRDMLNDALDHLDECRRKATP